MHRRIHEFSTFLRFFFRYWLVVSEVLIGLTMLIILAGVAISFVEERSLGESIYFSCITALSIGYGDVVPTTTAGRIISVFIGCVGMIFIGLTVAVATRALADTVAQLRKTVG